MSIEAAPAKLHQGWQKRPGEHTLEAITPEPLQAAVDIRETPEFWALVLWRAKLFGSIVAGVILAFGVLSLVLGNIANTFYFSGWSILAFLSYYLPLRIRASRILGSAAST